MSQVSISKFQITSIAFSAMMLLTIGCGPAPEPMGTLSGSVKSGDKPIGNCRIGIFCPETNQSISASVDDSATYKLDEIPFGEYQVWVSQMPTNAHEVVLDPRIPKKYRDKKTSGLTVSLNSTDEVVYDIDMSKK